jgi:hypothetical protein
MADGVATINVYGHPRGFSNTQRVQEVRGTITLTQGHYPVGGFALNWGAVSGIHTIPLGAQTASSTGTIMPIDLDAKSVANPPSGIVWLWDNVTGNLHAYITADAASANSGPLIEFGGAAMPQWMFGDTIQFRAVFARE